MNIINTDLGNLANYLCNYIWSNSTCTSLLHTDNITLAILSFALRTSCRKKNQWTHIRKQDCFISSVNPIKITQHSTKNEDNRWLLTSVNMLTWLFWTWLFWTWLFWFSWDSRRWLLLIDDLRHTITRCSRRNVYGTASDDNTVFMWRWRQCAGDAT